MKRTVACLCLIFALVFSLFGCCSVPDAPWEAALSGAFSASFSGELNGVNVQATVLADAPRADADGLFRSLSVVYRAPESLRDVTVRCVFYPETKRLSSLTLVYGELTIPNAAADDLIAPALLLATPPENAVLRRDKNGSQTLSDTAGGQRSLTFSDDGSPLLLQGVWENTAVRLHIIPSKETDSLTKR